MEAVPIFREGGMDMSTAGITNVDKDTLRQEVMKEYEAVAVTPDKGFHFHTGRPQALRYGYREEWLENVPAGSVESFAGTGNPFSMGELTPGECVVDIGSGAGIDSIIAANMVGPEGSVIGVDMTKSMLLKARTSAREAGLSNVEFREGFGEELPVPDEWADIVISNGVINLMPDKKTAFTGIWRVLKPGGRIQIADILVQKAVPEKAKQDISLWTG
jgi:SAM-dependent methyltransferase